MHCNRTHLVCVVAVLLGGLSACDSGVDPFIETENYFTLFGTLDMAQDTQFVRVIPIRRNLESSGTAPLPVTFVSVNRTTGVSRTWRDSVVSFKNGQIGHIFYAPFRVRPGHEYHLMVSKGDSVATVTTRVPPRPDAHVSPPDIIGGAFGQASGSQVVRWRNLVRSPYTTEVWYRFIPASEEEPPSLGLSFIDVKIPQSPTVEKLGSGWRYTLDLDDQRDMLDTLTNVFVNPMVGMGMRITVLDENFVPPGDAFDFERLVQPGTFSNVSNGFGFVGSIGRYSVEWTLAPSEAEDLGYVTLEELFGRRTAQRMQVQIDSSLASGWLSE